MEGEGTNWMAVGGMVLVMVGFAVVVVRVLLVGKREEERQSRLPLEED